MDTRVVETDQVFPSGLTIKQANELHAMIIQGTRIFGAIAIFAHILAWALTPWGK